MNLDRRISAAASSTAQQLHHDRPCLSSVQHMWPLVLHTIYTLPHAHIHLYQTQAFVISYSSVDVSSLEYVALASTDQSPRRTLHLILGCLEWVQTKDGVAVTLNQIDSTYASVSGEGSRRALH